MNNNFYKQDYKELKQVAKEEKIHTAAYQVETSDVYMEYNGVSFAFALASTLPDARMLKVAVSYCAVEDTFKKKIGKYQVLHKFIDKNEFIQMPLAGYFRDCGPEETADLLFGIFGSV